MGLEEKRSRILDLKNKNSKGSLCIRGSIEALGTLSESEGGCRKEKDGIGTGNYGGRQGRRSLLCTPTLAHSAAPTPLDDLPRPSRSYGNQPPSFLFLWLPLPLCSIWPASLSACTISRCSPRFLPSPHTPDSGPLPASWLPRSFNPDEEDCVRARRFRSGSPGGVGGSEPEGEGEGEGALPALQSCGWLLRLRGSEGAPGGARALGSG